MTDDEWGIFHSKTYSPRPVQKVLSCMEGEFHQDITQNELNMIRDILLRVNKRREETVKRQWESWRHK